MPVYSYHPTTSPVKKSGYVSERNTDTTDNFSEIKGYDPKLSTDNNCCGTVQQVCQPLKTICRPRFFAGQLLTEDDLSLLIQYMQDKNRLHNRFVHGWGVVCGLVVSCHCDSSKVKVSSGYALSPCGDDIIVPCESEIDICNLIRQCEDQKCTDPCAPPEIKDCPGDEQKWVLTIKYDECAKRAVHALRKGVRESCSCVCEEFPRPTAECEPTQICESFSFELFRLPSTDSDDSNERLLQFDTPIWEQMEACLRKLIEIFPEVGGDVTTATQLYSIMSDTLQRLKALVPSMSTTNCEIMRHLYQLCVPPPGTITYAQYLVVLMQFLQIELLPIIVEITRACICNALLPACPEAQSDDRVPLAVITAGRNPCEVLRICNWGQRKFAKTWQNMKYWLGILPLGNPIRQLIEKLCCSTLKYTPKKTDTFDGNDNASFSANMKEAKNYDLSRISILKNTFKTRSESAEIRYSETGDLFMESFLSKKQQQPLESLVAGMFGDLDENNNPVLSQKAMRNLVPYILMSQLDHNSLYQSLPASLKPLVELFSGYAEKPDDTDEKGNNVNGDDLDKMRKTESSSETFAEISEMKKELAALKKEVSKLKSKNKGST